MAYRHDIAARLRAAGVSAGVKNTPPPPPPAALQPVKG
jgi:hypothetical protein